MRPWLTRRAEFVLEPAMTLPAFASWFEMWRDPPEVLATNVVRGLIEKAGIRSPHPALRHDEISVGVNLSIDQLAAAQSGERIDAVATLVALDGRGVAFDVECRVDDRMVVGIHRRAIVECQRFWGGAG